MCTDDSMDTVNIIEKISMYFHETETDFVFNRLDEATNCFTTYNISKKEFFEAIRLARLKKECLDNYGVLISDDINTASYQKRELTKAYDRGYADGVRNEKRRVKNILEDLYKEDSYDE